VSSRGPDGAQDCTEAFSAQLLDERLSGDRQTLAELRADRCVYVLDRRDAQRAELQRVLGVPDTAVLADPGGWAFYPWRRTVVGVLGADAFRLLRLDRNRNKITREEQWRLRQLSIGVVGLSVGHAVAHTLALEGLCGELRLADFDTLDLSNLNRIPATVFDLGLNKSVVAARRIAELDPYLNVSVLRGGLTTDTMPEFLDGLDIVIEECDSLDIKVLLREQARARGIPVLMETSDRGLLDVERFDLEPDRPLFHGLLGDINAQTLVGLSTKDKVPHVLRLLDASALSPRIAASMVEVGQTLTTWPQLGGDVALGAATMAAAVRRLGLSGRLPSGRVRVDLDEHLDALEDSVAAPPSQQLSAERSDNVRRADVPAARPPAVDVTASVLRAVQLAPSGGNIQPWSVAADPDALRIYLARGRTTTMDVHHRGSYVAIGAALYNARVAASAAAVLGPVVLFADGADADLVATLQFGHSDDPRLTRRLAAMVHRGTNRHLGQPRPVPRSVEEALHDAALSEGAKLHLIHPGVEMVAAGELLAAADRVRYLTPGLHAEMFSELAWPGRDRLDVGIDVRTLELDGADLAKLAIAGRPEVMALLAAWGHGKSLGEDTRERIASSSALAVITVPGTAAADFVQGGCAAEAVWVCAGDHNLAVQPMSPVFLYGLDAVDLQELSPPYAADLAELRASLRTLLGLTPAEGIALILRLSHAETARIRSQRLPLTAILHPRGAAEQASRP